MSRTRRVIMGAAMAALVAVLVYLVVVPARVEVEIATARLGTIDEVVQSDAIFRSKERYIVPAFADGDIKRVDLKVGDPVRKGQAVAQLYWDVRYEPVRSPITGVISRVFRESAGPIRRGDPIVEVVDPTRLEVMAEMLTTDAARVHAGDEARISGWSGGGGEVISAKVIRVSKAGFTKRSALGVEEERTEVVADPERVPPGISDKLGSTFHVELSVVVSRTRGVLVIPVGAVFRDGQQWAVYKDVGGRARLARVELGARGEQDLEVRRGLAVGDRVIVYPGDLVRDGSRIRPKSLPS